MNVPEECITCFFCKSKDQMYVEDYPEDIIYKGESVIIIGCRCGLSTAQLEFKQESMAISEWNRINEIPEKLDHLSDLDKLKRCYNEIGVKYEESIENTPSLIHGNITRITIIHDVFELDIPFSFDASGKLISYPYNILKKSQRL